MGKPKYTNRQISREWHGQYCRLFGYECSKMHVSGKPHRTFCLECRGHIKVLPIKDEQHLINNVKYLKLRADDGCLQFRELWKWAIRQKAATNLSSVESNNGSAIQMPEEHYKPLNCKTAKTELFNYIEHYSITCDAMYNEFLQDKQLRTIERLVNKNSFVVTKLYLRI